MKRIVWVNYSVPIRVEIETSLGHQDALSQAKEKGALALRGFDPEFVSAEILSEHGETEFEIAADRQTQPSGGIEGQR